MSATREPVAPSAMRAGPHDRVVIYSRGSLADQDFLGREQELRDEAHRRGWQITDLRREMAAVPGEVDRNDYVAMLNDACSADRRWTHLLVWSLEQFSRQERFTRAIQVVLDLESMGVQFHSLRESMLDTPEGGRPNQSRDLLLALLPVISGFESRGRPERAAARRELKTGRRPTRSGGPPGRPRKLTAGVIAEIVRLRDQGLTWTDVSRQVGLTAGTCRYAGWLDRSTRANTGPGDLLRKAD